MVHSYYKDLAQKQRGRKEVWKSREGTEQEGVGGEEGKVLRFTAHPSTDGSKRLMN